MNLAEAPTTLLPAREREPVRVEPVARRKVAVHPSPAAQRVGLRLPPPVAFLSFDAFCRQVDGLVPPRELHFGGEGEPLLHPRFFDMVAYAAQRGLDVSATTRLPLLSPRRAEECVQSGLHRLHILPGPDPAGLVRRSLERLEEAKERLGSAFPDIVVAAAR